MKYTAIVVLIFFLAVGAQAQSNFFGITYDVSLPLGDTKDTFDNGIQWRGFGLEGGWYLNKSTTLGFSWNWDVFHYVTLETAQFNYGAATGYQNRTLNALPLLLTGHYYFKGSSSIQPYIGLGAGAYYIKRKFDLGLLSYEEGAWQFGFAPEAGLLFPMDSGFEFLLKLRYHYALESGDNKAVSYFGISLGFVTVSLW